MSLEAGSGLFEASDSSIGRITQDLSGKTWKMEKMRVGQGVSEGIHLLKSELSGNNFSWNAAQVPGDVYTDLFLAGELERKMYPATVYCQEEDYAEYIAAAAAHLSEADCKNEAKRLKAMDLTFEFGCSLDPVFIREKNETGRCGLCFRGGGQKAGS